MSAAHVFTRFAFNIHEIARDGTSQWGQIFKEPPKAKHNHNTRADNQESVDTSIAVHVTFPQAEALVGEYKFLSNCSLPDAHVVCAAAAQILESGIFFGIRCDFAETKFTVVNQLNLSLHLRTESHQFGMGVVEKIWH